MLRTEKILLTGPTSRVALPLATALAKDNEGVGLAHPLARICLRRRPTHPGSPS
jgi:hypothetical protein